LDAAKEFWDGIKNTCTGEDLSNMALSVIYTCDDREETLKCEEGNVQTNSVTLEC
jgi:hypothetical protein